MTWIAIGLALLNACCFTAGTWLQHSVSGDAPSLVAAARRPRWLAGLALLATGAVFQVIALRLAPVTVVEPAGVIGIVVGVLLGLRARSDRLRRSTGWALAAILVGTVAFAVLAALNTVPVPITTGALLTVGAAVSAVVAGCRFATRLLNGRARFLVLGVGGGAAYGCTSTLVRAATERYAAHGADVELLGILIGLAAAVLAGFWLVQRAHADGPPEGTVANLTVTDPLVAVSIGIGVLGEAPGLTWPIAGLGLVFAALAIGGVVRLSRDIPTGPDSTQKPPSCGAFHDRSITCPAATPSASSSARTPILPTSTARRTSRTAWPSGSPSVVTMSTSSAPPPRTPYPSASCAAVRRSTVSPLTAPRSIPASASACPGGSAERPPGCWTASHPTWFTYSPISA
ncbi:hypothetical protein GCM10010140_62120 [Streptosporangium pseudovulgare]|uniref:EamA domain-containing protein n=1 Tax=Streptosporangium pseudovulgare TaxID=35765 RepID=A0ABQ2RET7_9ACTN|nr:hypothetical protein GCM10010140_62120 [Streptosporangium pseudovulgare]